MAVHPRWSWTLLGSRSGLEAGSQAKLWLSGCLTAVVLKSAPQHPRLFFLWGMSVTWAEEKQSTPNAFWRGRGAGWFCSEETQSPLSWTERLVHLEVALLTPGEQLHTETSSVAEQLLWQLSIIPHLSFGWRMELRRRSIQHYECWFDPLGSWMLHVEVSLSKTQRTSIAPEAAFSEWFLSLNPDWLFHQHANECNLPQQLRRAGPQPGALEVNRPAATIRWPIMALSQALFQKLQLIWAPQLGNCC